MGSTCSGCRTAERGAAGSRGSPVRTRGPPSLLAPGLAERPVEQLADHAPDARHALALGQRLRIAAGHDHGIRPSWQTDALGRERLAQHALHAVALHRPADLARDGQAKSRIYVLPAREHAEHELTAGIRATAPEDAIEV